MRSIRRRIGFTYIGLILVVTIALGVFSSLEIEAYFKDRLLHDLSRQADQVVHLLITTTLATGADVSWYEHLQDHAKLAKLRLTLVADDGQVVFDSDVPLSGLAAVENHLRRPEIQQAVKSGTGAQVRFSNTVNLQMSYFARKLDVPLSIPTGSVRFIRLAVPLTEVEAVVREIRWKIAFAGLLVVLLVSALSLLISRQISARIKKMAATAHEIQSGNLERRIDVRGEDEIAQLGIVLNGMLDRLNADITKLKKLERVRSEFLGNVSHELRTPIFAIQGYLETLLQGALEDQAVNRDFIERAQKNATRLNTLLNDLIEISRIEFGEMKMSFRYFLLTDYLHSLIAEAKLLADRKGVALDVAIGTASSTEVLGDKERLRQVLLNLIDNAVKYTEKGGKVTLSSSDEGEAVRVSVADTGCGIAPEHLPRIFERFYRVDKDRSREMGGTGLGLAIVKHIVEAHGSRVEVESEVGKGSVFSFILKK
jgi:two-component system phosphate regulon sensor histidine kinase PhoR